MYVIGRGTKANCTQLICLYVIYVYFETNCKGTKLQTPSYTVGPPTAYQFSNVNVLNICIICHEFGMIDKETRVVNQETPENNVSIQNKIKYYCIHTDSQYYSRVLVY